MFQRISTWPECTNWGECTNWVGEITAIVEVENDCEGPGRCASVVCRQRRI